MGDESIDDDRRDQDLQLVSPHHHHQQEVVLNQFMAITQVSDREWSLRHLRKHYFDLERSVGLWLDQQQEERGQSPRFSPRQRTLSSKVRPVPKRQRLFFGMVDSNLSSSHSPETIKSLEHPKSSTCASAESIVVDLTTDPPSEAEAKSRVTDEKNDESTMNMELSQSWHDFCQRVLDMGANHEEGNGHGSFVDPDFPPIPTSLHGRVSALASSSPHSPSAAADAAAVYCHCGLPAAARVVASDGPNYGRFYLACGQHAANLKSSRFKRIVVPQVRENRQPSNNQAKVHQDAVAVVKKLAEGNDQKEKASRSIIVNPYAKTNANIAKQKIALKLPQSTPTIEPPSIKTSSPSSPRIAHPPKKCNFFRWDPDGSLGDRLGGYSSARYSLLAWHHFGLENGCCLVQKGNGFRPHQVQQGAVGNCWFLSALAVVSERPYLIRRIVPHMTLNEMGCYQINLFLDGRWTPIIVDSNLPVVIRDHSVDSNTTTGSYTGRKLKVKKTIAQEDAQRVQRGGVRLDVHDRQGSLTAYPAFCAATRGQLWPALVEKAYAKAHGSYSNLSGGFIAEGFRDLTGAPTETILLNRRKTAPLGERPLNTDLWRQLLQYQAQGFLMGLATSQGGEGLVGAHAYSLLQLVEIDDALIGEQAKMTDYFFRTKSDGNYKPSPATEESRLEASARVLPLDEQAAADNVLPCWRKPGERERTTIRLVQIRNPWGEREWKGEWSADSERWTNALRSRLSTCGTFTKGDGVFFMSFEDMIDRFHHLDVCKAREGWRHLSFDGLFEGNYSDPMESSSSLYLLRTLRADVAHISVIQPKKRANTRTKYWYIDPGLLIMKRKSHTSENWALETVALTGVQRESDCQVHLEASHEYCCVPFSFLANKTGDARRNYRISVYSNEPVGGEQARPTLENTDAAVRMLHRFVVTRDAKLLYRIEKNAILACVFGDKCVYFLVVNVAPSHFLSVRFNLNMQDGMLLSIGSLSDTYDISPRSERIIAVVCHSGRQSTGTLLEFSWITSLVATKAQPRPRNHRLKVGKDLDITVAGDLMVSTVDGAQVRREGSDSIETASWIPQIGSTS